MQFLDHWDLNRGELRNAKAHILGGFTEGLAAGDAGLMAFDSTVGQKVFGVWNGTIWTKLRDDWVSSVAVAAGSPLTITGTQSVTLDIALTNGSFLVGNGSNLARATLKSSIPLSGFGTAIANISMGSCRITNLADPVDPQDAATRAYVDATSQGLAVKEPCRVATVNALPAHTRSGNTLIASSNGLFPSIDGVLLSQNNRILVKEEAMAPEENGLYFLAWSGDGGTAWQLTRTTDADTSGEVESGMYTWVEEGTVNGASGWVLATAGAITLNTTALKFVKFTGSADVQVGNGLVKVGNTIHFAKSTAYSTNAIPLASGSATIGWISAGANNTVLRVPSGGGAPAFGAVDVSQAAAVTGALRAVNGGTGQDSSAWTGYAKITAGVWSAVATIPAAAITGTALTKVDDTNVTLTLGGSPSTALVAAASLTLGWSGQLAIARGGTGQATASAAFNALSPLTTLGDVLYGGASGAGTRLGGNVTTTRKFLSQTGTGVVSAAPSWEQIALSDITGSPVSGTGTQNYLPKWTGSGSIGNSSITDVAGTITISGLAGTGTRLAQVSAAGIVSTLANTTSAILGTDGSGVLGWRTDLPGTVTIGSKLIARKVTVTITAGAIGNVDMTHNLGTVSVIVMLRRVAGEYAMTTFKAISSNQVRLTFAAATTEDLEAVIIG